LRQQELDQGKGDRGKPDADERIVGGLVEGTTAGKENKGM